MEGYWAYDFVVFTVMHLAEVLLFSHTTMLDGRVLVPWFLSHPILVRIWVVCALLSLMFHGSWRIMGVFSSAGHQVLLAAFVSLEFV